MPIEQPLIADLNLALDEAMVERVRWDEGARQACVSVRVLGLPETEIHLDPRRDVLLHHVGLIRVLLRRDRSGAVPHGPAVPLPDQGALETFMDSLTMRDSMHDSKYVDDASAVDDWPPTISLTVRLPGPPSPHTLYWFTECGRPESGGMVAYVLEGVITFGDLSIRSPNGPPVPLRTFVADNRRWWHARWRDDPRTAPRAQRALYGSAWHEGSALRGGALEEP